jgi:hypothetical protein
MKFLKIFGCATIALSLLAACGQDAEQAATEPAAAPVEQAIEQPAAERNPRFDIYTEVTLNADLSHLNANQKQMLVLLVDAAKINGTAWTATDRS